MNAIKIPDDEFRSHPMFASLNDSQLSKIISGGQSVVLDAGDCLFSRGQSADHFFLLFSGLVKLYRVSPGGNEKIIEIVRSGQVFAEALMFMDMPYYPVSAEALEKSEVYSISNRQFMEVLRTSIDTSFKVMADISVRLHQLLNEIDALTLQNSTLRVINFLISQIPVEECARTEIVLPAAKNIIASRLSIKPETLSRIFHDLSIKGLISVKGLHIQVHDADGLRAYHG